MARNLVYRISPINGTVVFADPQRARHVDRLNRASYSATWAEFRKAMPRAEYSEVVQYFDDVGKRRPKGSDPFSADQLPGFSEGEHVPWLQRHMDCVLPDDILYRFAVRETGFTSGSWWSISSANVSEILAALRESGYVVEEAKDLEFW